MPQRNGLETLWVVNYVTIGKVCACACICACARTHAQQKEIYDDLHFLSLGKRHDQKCIRYFPHLSFLAFLLYVPTCANSTDMECLQTETLYHGSRRKMVRMGGQAFKWEWMLLVDLVASFLPLDSSKNTLGLESNGGGHFLTTTTSFGFLWGRDGFLWGLYKVVR